MVRLLRRLPTTATLNGPASLALAGVLSSSAFLAQLDFDLSGQVALEIMRDRAVALWHNNTTPSSAGELKMRVAPVAEAHSILEKAAFQACA